MSVVRATVILLLLLLCPDVFAVICLINSCRRHIFFLQGVAHILDSPRVAGKPTAEVRPVSAVDGVQIQRVPMDVDRKRAAGSRPAGKSSGYSYEVVQMVAPGGPSFDVWRNEEEHHVPFSSTGSGTSATGSATSSEPIGGGPSPIIRTSVKSTDPRPQMDYVASSHPRNTRMSWSSARPTPHTSGAGVGGPGEPLSARSVDVSSSRASIVESRAREGPDPKAITRGGRSSAGAGPLHDVLLERIRRRTQQDVNPKAITSPRLEYSLERGGVGR